MKLRPRGLGSRAFSLIELVAASGLVAIMGGLLAVNLRTQPTRGKANGLAQTVAAELRQARQLAISSQTPVAVAFPGTRAGAATPCGEGLYILEGWTSPRITRAASYSGDFPGCSIFNGVWPVNSAQFRNPSAPSNAANIQIPGQKWSNLNLANWLPAASARDYCFVFGPDGTCRTNDLPAFDNAYHIAVTSGVSQFTGASAPSGAVLPLHPSYFAPQSLGDTYTVNVDVGGAVSVTSGLTAMAGGAVSLTNGASGSAPGGQPLPPTPPGTPNVVVDTIDILPQSPGLAPGTDVSVSPNGFVTLRTQVRDTAGSGKRLYCNWIVTPQGGIVRGPSAYSIPVASGRGSAMDWDPSAQGGAGAWVSTWQWRPPVDSQAGDRFSLTLAVQDSTGASLTAAIPPKVVSVCPPGEVLMFGGFTYALWGDMWKMNPDGSGKQNFQVMPYTVNNPSPNNEGPHSVSADGNRICFGSDRVDVPGGRYALLLTDRDGSYCYQVSQDTAPFTPVEAGSLSPMGGLLAYRRYIAGTCQLEVVNTHPDALQRRNVVIDDLGAKGGNFLSLDPVREQLGCDFPTFDRRINEPTRNNVMYYVKNLSLTEKKKLLYSRQIVLEPDGRPLPAGSQPPATPVNEVNNFATSFGGPNAGVRSPRCYVRQEPGGPLVDLLFFTLDRFDGSPTQICVWDRTSNTVGPAYSPEAPKEEQPTPWTDGTVLRLFTCKIPLPAPGAFPSLQLLTPVAGAPAANRVEIAGGSPSYGAAARQAGNPLYLPRRRN